MSSCASHARAFHQPVYHMLTDAPHVQYEKVTKTQENITYNRTKRSALSQQVTTRLRGADK